MSEKFDWREHNKKVTQETLKVIEQGFYEKDGRKINLIGGNFDVAIVISHEQAAEFEENFSKNSAETRPEISVVKGDTFSMAAEGYLLMNFASAKSPGGGFLSGAYAQEETLCRQSTLYKSLSSNAAKEMYEYNLTHNKHCYSDYMIISPNVCVFRDVKYKFLNEPALTSVITVPAPNRRGAAKNVSQKNLDRIMKSRLRKMFAAAVHCGYKNLVLGAWGCGAFGHNPDTVAKYFYEVLCEENFGSSFEKIIFAIYDKGEGKNFNAFAEVFKQVAKQ